jgi:hypothetical protein
MTDSASTTGDHLTCVLCGQTASAQSDHDSVGSIKRAAPDCGYRKPEIPFRGLAWRILQAEAGARKLR